MSSDASYDVERPPQDLDRGLDRAAPGPLGGVPRLSAVLELFKPVTWFPPMWAFMCGVVSSGADLGARWLFVLGGIVLAGPLICATSQAVNDWFDRHVDAINQPERPIPSGRIPGHWGLIIAGVWTAASLAFAALLGQWVFVAAVVGLAFAWAYSAPPFRLKRSGWLGPAAVAISYEGLAWFTGAAVMMAAFPSTEIVVLAALYSIGAHGIMVLNDFKAIEGDRRTGVRSLPVMLGVERAALVACVTMLIAQIGVVVCLAQWGHALHAGVIGVATLAQVCLMVHLAKAPAARAPWYNATGVTLYVLGMMVAAFAVRAAAAGGAQ
jgi:chlorophyll/bacteriochlorophyll a synthase